MLAAIAPVQFQPSSVIVSLRSDNNVVHGTYFHRYQYSHGHAVLSGVYLVVNLKGIQSSDMDGHTSRHLASRIDFDTTQNKALIQDLAALEETLLKLVCVDPVVQTTHGLADVLRSGVLRNVSGDLGTKQASLILRVSGVWEDASKYGLVYRFIVPSHPL